MPQQTLEERVARLERQVAQLLANSSGRQSSRMHGMPQSEQPAAQRPANSNKPGSDDWRKTIGMFTDDEGMLQLFQEALNLREKDRERARRPAAKRRGARK